MEINTHTPLGDELIFRKPELDDGEAIYKLVKKSPPLDVNSRYLYFLQADQFSDTCVLAEKSDQIVGFISAYFNPQDENNLFVWQVAVDNTMRGQRVGKKLLDQLVSNQEKTKTIKKITTTISPSNKASQKLFESYARSRGFSIASKIYLPEELFGEDAHEAEWLYTLQASND